LRTALAACDQPARPGGLAARRVRRAERRAQGALARAGFADPAVAAAVLRHVQVLTMTAALARLDYRTADAAYAVIASLIGAPAGSAPAPGAAREGAPAAPAGSNPVSSQPEDAVWADGRGARLVAAATRIVAGAARDGDRLSQAALAARLRREGYTVANSRLRWLACASGLEARHAGPDGHLTGDQ
jgi:hypothetical protein